MHKLAIKPLSTNEAFMGRKRKTAKYRNYEIKLPKLLPKLRIPRTGPLSLCIRVGYSNRASDIDNCLKPFIDVLQKHYGFNDNRIYYLEVTKVKTDKGEEYISFKLNGLSQEPVD
jgi:Holliday junction resolvase RusA-like endonuclease